MRPFYKGPFWLYEGWNMRYVCLYYAPSPNLSQRERDSLLLASGKKFMSNSFNQKFTTSRKARRQKSFYHWERLGEGYPKHQRGYPPKKAPPLGQKSQKPII